eukprot:4844927-Amphidinium_carterae.1
MHEQVHLPVGKPSEEPKFEEYQTQLSSLPQYMKKEVDTLTSYYPAEIIEPPYADFYKDGSRGLGSSRGALQKEKVPK